jgi:hypothetical protein
MTIQKRGSCTSADSDACYSMSALRRAIATA